MTIYAKTHSRLAAVVVRRDTKAGVVFDYVVQALVLMALAVFSIGTLPDLDPADRHWLEMAETAILAVFTFEYVLRIWVSENRWSYVFQLLRYRGPYRHSARFLVRERDGPGVRAFLPPTAPAADNQGGTVLRGGVQAEAGMGTDQGRTDALRNGKRHSPVHGGGRHSPL